GGHWGCGDARRSNGAPRLNRRRTAATSVVEQEECVSLALPFGRERDLVRPRGWRCESVAIRARPFLQPGGDSMGFGQYRRTQITEPWKASASADKEAGSP